MICGVDEAGRGPLAGAVYAAAVVLPEPICLQGLDDSKRLRPAQRARLDREIRASSLAFAVACCSVEEIEQLNILQASLLAMRRAVESVHLQLLSRQAALSLALIDGNQVPRDLPCEARCIVGGDALEPAIAAASILAKVARDQEMERLALAWPGYGFERHKGYGTVAHLEALKRLGPSPVHRRGFAPVRDLLAQ